jgi:hypothetical protein
MRRNPKLRLFFIFLVFHFLESFIPLRGMNDSKKTNSRTKQRDRMNESRQGIITWNFALTMRSLYEAGGDDATFGSCEGVAFGDLDREANSLEEAIRSAIADVDKAGFGVARVERIEQSLVSTISAELTGSGKH